jgi:hypothetical protein
MQGMQETVNESAHQQRRCAAQVEAQGRLHDPTSPLIRPRPLLVVQASMTLMLVLLFLQLLTWLQLLTLMW